ncbi:MAG: glycosyltransferase family 2 protein [Dehalococcoidia bacterium]|nr:glycosyltransferase family 2 protein [Dehalococcoidia bacterium]
MAAYNEALYVGDIVRQAKQHVDEVIVVDDGSTDDTAAIAGAAGATVIRHTGNRGKGAAVQTILAEARKRNPQVLVLLDADGQHDPGDIPALIKPVYEGFDLVIGSREAQRNRTPRYRRVGQRVLLRLARLASRTGITDSESGFRALSPRAINELQLTSRGFAVEAEMITLAADKDLRITEVPITNIYTVDGSTLHPLRHGVDVMSGIIVMIAQRRPLFLFGLLGGVLLTVAIIISFSVLNTFLTEGDLSIGRATVVVIFLIAAALALITGIILNVLRKRS